MGVPFDPSTFTDQPPAPGDIGSTQDLEQRAGNPNPLVKAFQAQSAQLDDTTAQLQQTQTQLNDPAEKVKAALLNRYQSNQIPPASGGPIRRFLQNFFSGGGEALMHASGVETPRQAQERDLNDYEKIANTQSLDQFRQAQSSQYEDVMVPGPDGTPVPMAKKNVPAWFAAQARAQATTDAATHKTINVPGVGAFNWDDTQGKYLPIGGAQIPQHQLAPGEAKAMGFPEGTTQVPEGTYAQAKRLQGTISSTIDWKETSPGVWQALPKTTTKTYGKGQIQGAANAAAPSGSSSTPSGGGIPTVNGLKTVAGGNPVYAYDSKSDQTLLTTPQEAQAKGYTNPRKVTAKEIQDDTLLNNRLTDVATKVQVYDKSIGAPISATDRAKMADLLADDKLSFGAFGAHVPTDWLSKLTQAMSVAGLSDAAKQRMINYMNVREAMMGYTRVLSGSSRGSDKNLELNLQVMPSPIMPEEYTKQGLTQFKQNLDIVSQGMPKLPGVASARDVLHPAPAVQFKEGNDLYNIPADKVERFKQLHPQAVPNAR